MSDLRPLSELAAVYGESAFPGIESYAALEDIPDWIRIVVVHFDEAKMATSLKELQEHRCGGRIVAWLEVEQAERLEYVLGLGFDDVTVGVAQTIHRLNSIRWELDLLDGYTARTLAHTGLVSFIGELVRRPALQDVLRTAILGMRDLFSMDRVSVVFVRPGEEFGYVVMERNRQLDNVVIKVDDYPELIEVMRTREPIVISDVFGDELLQGVRVKLEEAEVSHRSAVLFPLQHKREVVGALFLRSETPMLAVEDRLIGMGRLIALVTSVAIGNGLEQDDLLSEQRMLLRNKEVADKKLADLQKFEHLFERATDGFLLIDADGLIRYSNASAVGLLGREHESLHGALFIELFDTYSRPVAERALMGYDVGDRRGYVDLSVALRTGSQRIISAAIRHLHSSEGVLVSFRDVTEQRALEAELQQTKEFLENLIQSSVDAIMAADMAGRVILFNRAAERILGYSAHEAVGSLDVREIYRPGGAYKLMSMLRSNEHGGRGRLELLRRELVAKNSEVVPINLTAAIIYEGGEEIATVGIFTDLRERLRMEEKLEKAQQELRMNERQSIAIELAGAAAHELNQPLTSVMGYAELLKKKIGDDAKNKKAVGTICRETSRMAEIVKRLGQITRYEKRPYVGGASILSLSPDDQLPDK